jgi:COMPASS component SWD1
MEIFIHVEYINMSCFILQEFDGALDCISLAVTCAFNKRGTLLAVGCNDGRIVIWDFLTRGIAKIISAHVHPVCSLRLV